MKNVVFLESIAALVFICATELPAPLAAGSSSLDLEYTKKTVELSWGGAELQMEKPVTVEHQRKGGHGGIFIDSEGILYVKKPNSNQVVAYDSRKKFTKLLSPRIKMSTAKNFPSITSDRWTQGIFFVGQDLENLDLEQVTGQGKSNLIHVGRLTRGKRAKGVVAQPGEADRAIFVQNGKLKRRIDGTQILDMGRKDGFESLNNLTEKDFGSTAWSRESCDGKAGCIRLLVAIPLGVSGTCRKLDFSIDRPLYNGDFLGSDRSGYLYWLHQQKQELGSEAPIKFFVSRGDLATCHMGTIEIDSVKSLPGEEGQPSSVVFVTVEGDIVQVIETPLALKINNWSRK